MKSRFASVRTGGEPNRVDRAVRLLEDEWQRHGEVQLERFWAREQERDALESVEDVGLLAELVKTDLRCRFAEGQTPTAAGYLERFPELRATDSRVLSLVYEEYCLNEERGTAPDVESFCNRYPEWKSSLASQLQYHRLFSQVAGRRPALPCFPEAGQDFEEFHLEAPLGEGGTSRVFLARDLSLGGKQVVLKVTIDRGQEPKAQGPLDHPHIVPVNSVVYQTHGELCGLSMPYRPGLPLDQVITRVKPAGRPRKAIAFWQVIASGVYDPSSPLALGETKIDSHASEHLAGPRGDGWDGFPVRGTYSQGVAWIVMVLARALNYAHGKQTFHRDVKPGNVLLTLRHGPQLLDFNLAESPHSADHARAAVHGGTLPYMAPEQIEAFINPALWDKVGARADIYSLGLVLRELLTGQKPELPDPALPPARALRAVLDRRPLLDVTVRGFNPQIPHALQAIVAKCLTLCPEDRYTDARELERDLDRFLRYQPLPQFANPSRPERVGNWMMRSRRVLTSAACTIVLGTLLYGVWHSRPVDQPRRPGIEASFDFHKALGDIGRGEFRRAAELLSRLELKDRHSCLVKFYLSLALNDDVKTRPLADKPLRSALANADATITLTAWARNHPEVVSYLVDFSYSTIIFADEFAEKMDNQVVDEAIPNEVRDREIRQPRYELARDALGLAETIDPSSRKIQFLLAKTEQINGEHPAAHDRLSRVINAIRSDERPDSILLLFCRDLRGRVATVWAEAELKQAKAGSMEENTLGRLQEAVQDLEMCTRTAEIEPFSTDGTLKKYHLLHDKLRATLTLAEVEAHLNRRDEANRHLRLAQKNLNALIEHIHAYQLDKKVPQPTKLTQRLKDDRSRLQGPGFAISRSPKRAEGQPTDTGSGGG